MKETGCVHSVLRRVVAVPGRGNSQGQESAPGGHWEQTGGQRVGAEGGKRGSGPPHPFPSPPEAQLLVFPLGEPRDRMEAGDPVLPRKEPFIPLAVSLCPCGQA